ncbi:MAG: transposase [Pseudomonadota bacterium]
MASVRSETVVEGEEGLYHCIARCVRRAFLCGKDPYTGRSFEHRKEWVRERLKFLSSVFAIEVCAYAVMSNHLHAVIRTRPDWAQGWSNEETARRWLTLFPPRDENGIALEVTEGMVLAFSLDDQLGDKRTRLGSVSWLMRCLNEAIARRANREDGCKGRFWEGRFKCQALLDDSAVLACMTYVDLNPIRAGMSDSPETSFFTSARERITASKFNRGADGASNKNESPARRPIERLGRNTWESGPAGWLCPFGGEGQNSRRGILEITAEDYLSLLDWTGRQIRDTSGGVVPGHLAPILDRLDIEQGNWLSLMENYGRLFHRAVGKVGSLRQAARKAGLRWFQGLGASKSAFSSLAAD